MKFLLSNGLLLLSAGVLLARPAGCGHGSGAGCGEACNVQVEATAPLVLSESVKATLIHQIEEERMAGELYRAFGAKFEVRPFQNIPQAEARHQQMLETLAMRAGMHLATTTTPGRYATPAIQARYDALLVRGRVSLIEALRVGALVEEQDIADLRVLAAASDNPELKSVITALEQGSRHHLTAFGRNLRARGIDYVAQILSPAEVAEIMAAGPERPGRRFSQKD